MPNIRIRLLRTRHCTPALAALLFGLALLPACNNRPEQPAQRAADTTAQAPGAAPASQATPPPPIAPAPADSALPPAEAALAPLRRAILAAERFELVELGAAPDSVEPAGTDMVMTWPVVRLVPVPDSASRATLLAALTKGIETTDKRRGLDCFEPRHAIRAFNAGRRIELLFSFNCGHVVGFVDNDNRLALALGPHEPPIVATMLAGNAAAARTGTSAQKPNSPAHP